MSFEVPASHANNALASPPSFLEYLGYLYFWSTVSLGPMTEFKDYRAFIDRSLFEKTKGHIPKDSWKAFFWILLNFLLTITVLSLLLRKFHLGFLCRSGWVTQSPLFTRWMYLLVAFPVCRCTFYCGWYLSRGATVLSGFSFTGYDENGKSQWQRGASVDLFTYETGTSFRSLVNGWNVGTAYFLRRCKLLSCFSLTQLEKMCMNES